VLDCIVTSCGFTFVRQDGSHRLYTKKGCIRPLVIPVHNKNILEEGR
jgi:predicted RNA binding protein YcfA (HicA-like mRNA interferase family)